MATLLGVIAIGVFILLMVAVSRNKSARHPQSGNGDGSNA
jgi:hypothetical protein